MKTRATSILFILPIFVIIMSLSSCENVSNIIEHSISQEEDTDNQITIGVVLPMTGRLVPTFGEPIHQGLELAFKELNESQLAGVNIELIIEDDGSTVDGAVRAFNKLIVEDEVSIILGPSTSAATKEAFPIAQENRVVAISPTSAARGLSAIGDYVFRIALTTDVLVPNGIQATHKKLGYKTAATLYDETDEFASDGDAAVQEVLAAIGVKLLIRETFKGGDTDFTEQLTRIKEENPDVIFVSSLPPEKPGILLKGKELGITARFIIRTLTEADVDAAREAAEGAITFVGWGTAVDTVINQTFIKNYSDTYGMKPNNYAARTYAAVQVLAEGIKNADSHTTNDIRDALASIRDFETVLGEFSFDENGDAIYDPKILIVNNGKLELY